MHSFPSMVAHRKMCLPTGKPRSWFSEGSAKRKSLTSCEMEVFDTSLHGIFSRGLRATLRGGSGGFEAISLIGAKWVNSEFPCTELFGDESEV